MYLIYKNIYKYNKCIINFYEKTLYGHTMLYNSNERIYNLWLYYVSYVINYNIAMKYNVIQINWVEPLRQLFSVEVF